MKKMTIVYVFFSIFIVACSVTQNLVKMEEYDLGVVPERKGVDQGWTKAEQDGFWFTSQGSEIMPYDWFLWLEQSKNRKLFRHAAHMQELGYLPMNPSKLNPDGLPIGFVKTRVKSKKKAHFGLTCSACHTNDIEINGQNFLVDGAPTLANFVLFFDRLVEALELTHQDDGKFNRFAQSVLKDKYTSARRKDLREDLGKVAGDLRSRINVNALPHDYPAEFTSYGRLDAFGNIENAGTAFALNDTANRNPPTAPVSYPFLWGTHQSDFVQWNASAPNKPYLIGPLSRNIGEVVGVFGKLEIKKAGLLYRIFGRKFHYKSSVDFKGLGELESYVKTLRAPKWEKMNALPALKPKLVAEGKKLFADNCASCHQVITHVNELIQHYECVKTALKDVGTDPAMAWESANHQAKSLYLEGTKAKVVVGSRLEAETRALNIPVKGVAGLALSNPRKALSAGLAPMKVRIKGQKPEQDKAYEDALKVRISTFDDIVDEHQETMDKDLEDDNKPAMTFEDCCLNGLVYKARPLNGIWATAPYLHNGSVPNLWELLKNPEKRVKKFWVGSHKFDAKNVGFITDKGKNEFKVMKADGKEMQPGNSNLGHDYGTNLTKDEKKALIEYMKTL